MSEPQLCAVRVSRTFSVPPERVFDAWLDPATAGKWLFATETGTMVRVEIDARVGGTFNFTDHRNGEDVAHVGEYLELDRPRRLVFGFRVPKYSPLTAQVTIEIEKTPNGCEVTLTTGGVLEEYRERTEKGWGMILDKLAGVLGSG